MKSLLCFIMEYKHKMLVYHDLYGIIMKDVNLLIFYLDNKLNAIFSYKINYNA